MGEHRIRRTAQLKFTIAVEAIKGQKQISELATEYGVHPQQISEWKRQLLEHGADVFASAAERDAKRIEEEREELYKTVGHQKVQIDWLKKSLRISRLPNEEP